MTGPSRKPGAPEGASPTMAQWFALKTEHPDALLFMRMGDFFEMFFEDAQAAAAALDITLTQRGEHAGAPIPMCGVPVNNADLYLARLIRRGFRVAVAEQMEAADARQGRGPIRREIVRLVTPGTLTEDSLLDAGRANFLLALVVNPDCVGAAWLEISTGLFQTEALKPDALASLLGRLDPAEILAAEALDLGDWSGKRGACPRTAVADRRAAPLGRCVWRREPRRLRHFLGRRSDRRRLGDRLCSPHPGRPDAASLAPGSDGGGGADGHGCGDPGEPGNFARARRRHQPYPASQRHPHHRQPWRTAAGRVACRPSPVGSGDFGTAGRLGLPGRQPRPTDSPPCAPRCGARRTWPVRSGGWR